MSFFSFFNPCLEEGVRRLAKTLNPRNRYYMPSLTSSESLAIVEQAITEITNIRADKAQILADLQVALDALEPTSTELAAAKIALQTFADDDAALDAKLTTLKEAIAPTPEPEPEPVIEPTE